MLLTLTRDPEILADIATTGVVLLTDAGVNKGRWLSIEQPWNENAQGHSCVPAGTYSLIPYMSPKHGATWQLHAPHCNVYGCGPVPDGGRSLIEIHSANWASQLEGCIALGTGKHPLLNPETDTVEPAVVNSRCAVAELLSILGPMSRGHYLEIL